MADETPRARGTLMTPAEVADHLRMTPNALAKMRSKGTGPAYRKLDGRNVRYHPRDVLEFIEACKRTTTGAPDA